MPDAMLSMFYAYRMRQLIVFSALALLFGRIRSHQQLLRLPPGKCVCVCVCVCVSVCPGLVQDPHMIKG